MSKSDNYPKFVTNVRWLLGSAILTTGLSLSSAGIYEFHTAKKIGTDNAIYKHSSIIRYFVDNLNDMKLDEKTGFGSPLIMLGLFLLPSIKKPRM